MSGSQLAVTIVILGILLSVTICSISSDISTVRTARYMSQKEEVETDDDDPE